MGELEELETDGTQARLLEYVSSVNISCNAHAGSDGLIERTMVAALERGVRIGAHPGYPDRANMGRLVMRMDREALVDCIARQLDWFRELAAKVGVPKVTHVKAHGALYNAAVKDAEIAGVIAEATRGWDVVLVGLAGSPMLDVFWEAGFGTMAEGFADRAYEPDGTLRSRTLPGALIEDPQLAAEQAERLFRSGKVQTVCIHSDTPGAVAIARAVRAGLAKGCVQG